MENGWGGLVVWSLVWAFMSWTFSESEEALRVVVKFVNGCIKPGVCYALVRFSTL